MNNVSQYTGPVSTLYVQPVLSIRKLRSISNALLKSIPSNHFHSCSERGILLSEDLKQKGKDTKVCRRQDRRPSEVSWAMIYYVRNRGKLRQSDLAISPQMKSLLESIRKIQYGRKGGYSLAELLSEQRRQPSPLLQESAILAARGRLALRKKTKKN